LTDIHALAYLLIRKKRRVADKQREKTGYNMGAAEFGDKEENVRALGRSGATSVLYVQRQGGPEP
jgi:hypothetical protein